MSSDPRTTFRHVVAREGCACSTCSPPEKEGHPMFDEDLGPDQTRYRVEQDPQTGVITATIQAAAFDARGALELARRSLGPEIIADLAGGFEEQKSMRQGLNRHG